MLSVLASKIQTWSHMASASPRVETVRDCPELGSGAGFTAAVRTAEGHSKRIRDFDPAAEETIFFPRLQGG